MSQKKFLLIQDKQPLLETVKRKLESRGFNVLVARSIKQALSYLEFEKSEEIAIILLGKNKTILVVEDEQPLLEVIKKKLESNGFSVVTARSVEQALAYLNDIRKIDMIWLDHYLLGKKTGLDFVAKLKNGRPSWRKIPIFLISNYSSLKEHQSYIDLGISKYYPKADYSLDQIIEEIKVF